MCRFISAYRWELLLLFVAPLVGSIANQLALFSTEWWSITRGSGGGRYLYYGGGAFGALATAGFLGLLYGRVHGLGREFLTLTWGYVLAISIVGALLGFALFVLGPAAFGDVTRDLQAQFEYYDARVVLGALVTLPVLVVFARRASRLSLTHAFFLFLVFQATPAVDLILTVSSIYDQIASPLALEFRWLLFFPLTQGFNLVEACVLAWLLGNFILRGELFRRQTVLVLFALVVAGWMHVVVPSWDSPLIFWRWLLEGVAEAIVLGTILPLALIYLVRVRRPTPAVGTVNGARTLPLIAFLAVALYLVAAMKLLPPWEFGVVGSARWLGIIVGPIILTAAAGVVSGRLLSAARVDRGLAIGLLWGIPGSAVTNVTLGLALYSEIDAPWGFASATCLVLAGVTVFFTWLCKQSRGTTTQGPSTPGGDDGTSSCGGS